MNKEQKAAVQQRLREIEQANGGRLTPDDVVADAKKADSPLHPFFEWNKTKAAHAYWLEQARTLITSVVVMQKTEKVAVSTVFYVRDPTVKHNEQGYVSIETIRSDADMARDFLAEEFGRAASALARAKAYAKVLKFEEDVDHVIEEVKTLERKRQEAVVTA